MKERQHPSINEYEEQKKQGFPRRKDVYGRGYPMNKTYFLVVVCPENKISGCGSKQISTS